MKDKLRFVELLFANHNKLSLTNEVFNISKQRIRKLTPSLLELV